MVALVICNLHAFVDLVFTTASLTVVAPPSITKAFDATNVPVNGTTSLTLTISNPNSSTALTGVALTDNFPSGLVVANPSGLSSTCDGPATATAGGGSVTLSGGTVAAGSSCAVSVNVTAMTFGNKVNTTGNGSSTNGGTGNTGSATLGVGDFFLVFSPTSQTIPAGHIAVYSLTVDTNTGFQGTVNLTCSEGPAGSTCTIIPSSGTLTASAQIVKVTIDLAVPKGASRGTFTLTFTGTSGMLSHSQTATLTVK